MSALFFVVLALPASGQARGDGMDMPAQSQSGSMHGMPGMGEEKMSMKSASLVEYLIKHATSDTDAEPKTTPFGMIMTTGDWTLMFLGDLPQRNPAERSARRRHLFHQLVDADGPT